MVIIHQTPPGDKPNEKIADLEWCPFVVAIDSREQAPFSFQQILLAKKQWFVPRRTVLLETGDYSIVGCENLIAIERKSTDDLLNTIGAGHGRFRREHERMLAIKNAGGFAAVVVEGGFAEIWNELDAGVTGRRITSDLVIGIVASWPQQYGVAWHFAGDRRRAELLTFRILWKWWDQAGIATD